jgi:3-oxoacyl-[acyl-carrier-protein] synthase-3
MTKFSIVIPTYQRKDGSTPFYLKRCLDSIFKQDYSNFKIFIIGDKYENIAGASVPIALDDAVKNGEIKKGDTIVLTAIGSGWTWGSTILKWVK